MSLSFKSQLPNLDGIYAALFAASEVIYAELKQGSGLKFATSSNESGDDQIELDVIADEAFFETLSQDPNVRYVVSEERPGMSKISDGDYSIHLTRSMALNPLWSVFRRALFLAFGKTPKSRLIFRVTI